MNQVNSQQNLSQTIISAHYGLQPIARIITEKFDNIQIEDRTIIHQRQCKMSRRDTVEDIKFGPRQKPLRKWFIRSVGYYKN